MQKVRVFLEFIRKLLNRGNNKDESKEARGVAPLQTPEEQEATRERMEAEMDQQRDDRERRAADKANQ